MKSHFILNLWTVPKDTFYHLWHDSKINRQNFSKGQEQFHQVRPCLLLLRLTYYVLSNNFVERRRHENPTRPFVAVVGGSKVSGKLQALNKLIDKVDKIIIGGGMAFTFLKAMGYEVGNSLVENDLLDEANRIMAKAPPLIFLVYYLLLDLSPKK